MNNDRYGDYEQVNGAVVNDALDRIKELEDAGRIISMRLLQVECPVHLEDIENKALDYFMPKPPEKTNDR